MPTDSIHRLAIYDMDKTITHTPTWTPFLVSAARATAPWRLALLPLAGVAAAGYAARIIDRARLKQATQALLVGGRLSADDAASAADAFAERTVRTGVFRSAHARIAADRADGYRLVIATASYRFYAQAIAHRLGFDATIGTETIAGKGGTVTARILGENCYGPAKLRMIEAWMAREGLQRDQCYIRFYSDHVSDAPTFEWADEAFVVNAHGPLRTLARLRGWPVLDWER